MPSVMDIFEGVRDQLKFTAPSYMGRKYIARGGAIPPNRYVWVLAQEGFTPPNSQMMTEFSSSVVETGSDETTQVLHPLRDRAINVLVHIWAKPSRPDMKIEDDDSVRVAEDLRDALVSALEEDVSANYELTSATWMEPEEMVQGIVLVQGLRFTLPLLKRSIATTAKDATPTPEPERTQTVTPDTFQTANSIFTSAKPAGWIETDNQE